MIFAREINDPLTGLVKKIDEATVKHSDCSMGSFVVFCSDEEGLDKKLKALAEKEHLKKIVLTVDNPSGPPRAGAVMPPPLPALVAAKAGVTVALLALFLVWQSRAPFSGHAPGWRHTLRNLTISLGNAVLLGVLFGAATVAAAAWAEE